MLPKDRDPVFATREGKRLGSTKKSLSELLMACDLVMDYRVRRTERGRHLLLSGDPVAPGELVAEPSATKVGGIAKFIGGNPLVRIFAIALMALMVPAFSVAREMPRGVGKVDANGIEIAYQSLGPKTGEPLLFIQGVGGVVPSRPDALTDALVGEGFRVILFDNRDAGASTHLDEAGMPDFEAIQQALGDGRAPPVAYTLDDMADDAVGLLEALDIGRVHIVGGSLGGMIAQIVASEHPERAASLTLISSSTGNPALQQGEAPAGDEAMDPATARQAAAAAVIDDLSQQSAGIEAPTVVIHGDRDQLFPLAHGRDLASTIPGARLVVIPGMDHVPEESFYPTIVDAIRSVARTTP